MFVPQGSESAVPNLKKKAAEKTKPAASAPAAKEVKPQPKASEAEPFPSEIAGVPAIPSIDMPDDDAPWVPETDSVPADDLDWMAPPAWPEEYSEEAGVSVLPPAPQEKQKEYIPAEPVQMNAWLEAAEKTSFGSGVSAVSHECRAREFRRSEYEAHRRFGKN